MKGQGRDKKETFYFICNRLFFRKQSGTKLLKLLAFLQLGWQTLDLQIILQTLDLQIILCTFLNFETFFQRESVKKNLCVKMVIISLNLSLNFYLLIKMGEKF